VTKTVKGKGKGSERARKKVKGRVKVTTFILLFTVYPTLPRPRWGDQGSNCMVKV
jgi:hypothetical protein